MENTEPESVTHLNFRLRQAIGARDYPQAVEISERLCSALQPLSREYAEASYMRALVADLMDDTPTAQVWFARSAMTDIQLAIRDNAALKSLANTLLDDDNIQRAMRYMRIVMDDARFFNSRLRPWQDALALHVIEEAYRSGGSGWTPCTTSSSCRSAASCCWPSGAWSSSCGRTAS